MAHPDEELAIANELINQYASERAQLDFDIRNLTIRLKRAEARITELTAGPEEPEES